MSVGLSVVRKARIALIHKRTSCIYSVEPTLKSVTALRNIKFPYGKSSFKTIMSEGSFFVDKTLYIKVLEASGKYIKIWRPRCFGKTLVCDMLSEYYDLANSAEEVQKSSLC